MVESLAKLVRLPAATRVYCGHEYTMANIRFAQAVEPGNGALDERKECEAAKLLRGEPTLPSTIGLEAATNPFLRCGEREVIASAEKHAGRKLSSAVDVFAEIRAWKNAF
jgi:hydroxyacylglutathione hydrolase